MNGVLAVFIIIGWREVTVSGDHIGQAIEIYHFCILAVSLCYVHYRCVLLCCSTDWCSAAENFATDRVTERRNQLQSEITDMMTTWQITGPANVLLLLRKDSCICIRDIKVIVFRLK